MIRSFLAAIVLLLGLQTAPLSAQDGDDAAEPPAATGQAQDDAALRREIRAVLTELEGYGDVRITVRSGVVILEGEVVDHDAADRLESVVASLDQVAAVESRVTMSTALDKRLDPAAERLRGRVSQTVAILPLALVALAAAAAVWAVGFLIARRLRFSPRIAPNAFIAEIYRQVLRLVFVLGGIVLALDIMSATALLSTILGAAGLVGLALGFAVRDTVENFIASIMLSLRQPFRPNDAVMIEGHEGHVIRLTSRATILLDFDGNHVRIPNSTVFKGRIVNYTANPERRFLFTLGVEPECDLAALQDVMERTLTALPFVLDSPAVAVWIETINEGGLIFTLTGWIDQRDTSLPRARGEALRAVKTAVEAAGAVIPDTTYRIRLDRSGAAPTDTSMPLTPPVPDSPAQDVSGDDAIRTLVDAERAEKGAGDLLSETAEPE